MAAFFFAFERDLIPENVPLLNWIPLFGIILINSAFSAGYSSIIYGNFVELVPPEFR